MRGNNGLERCRGADRGWERGGGGLCEDPELMSWGFRGLMVVFTVHLKWVERVERKLFYGLM